MITHNMDYFLNVDYFLHEYDASTVLIGKHAMGWRPGLSYGMAADCLMGWRLIVLWDGGRLSYGMLSMDS